MQTDTPHIERWNTQDIDEQSALMTGWEQEYRQLSCGKFNGNITVALGAQVCVARESTNQSLHQRVMLPKGQLGFGLVLQREESLHINRKQVSTACMVALEGGREYDFRTTGCTDTLGIIIDEALVFGHDGAHTATIQSALRQGVVPLDPNAAATLQNLGRILALVLRREATWPSNMPLPQLAGTALNNIALALAMSAGLPAPVSSAAAERQARVVQRAIHFMRTNLDQEFSMADVCAATHVSQRTLQYHFESCLHVSPQQYLKALRLNAARSLIRKLNLEGQQQRPSIAEIAAQCGYEHPSRFAGDFRRQFGLLPSEALAA